MSGTLYIIATPIGNLDDITPRALQTLKSVRLLLCEDTRVTRKLLSRFEISVPVESYREQNHAAKVTRVIELLHQGNDVGLTSDAGTPGVSDPGTRLVRDIIATDPEIRVVPIPGPSAVTAAVSAAGFPAMGFVFLGFPPHKKGRTGFFEYALNFDLPAVLFESPHRIMKALTAIAESAPERQLCVLRELTKIHETVYRGTAAQIIATLKQDNGERGEFVIVIEGKNL
jgi:16S rRNA (cytidine1402-2'-O)-methyltransferase